MAAKVMIFLIAALMAIGYVACESPVRRKHSDKPAEKLVEQLREQPAEVRKKGRMENLEHEEVHLMDVDETPDSHNTEEAHSNVKAQEDGTLNRHKRGGYGGGGHGYVPKDQGNHGHEKIVVVVGEGHKGHGGYNGHEGYDGGYDGHGGHGGHGGYDVHGGHGGGRGYGGGHGYGRR